MRVPLQPILTAAILGALIVIMVSVEGPSTSASTDRKVQRVLDQSRIDEIKRHDLNLHNLRHAYINDIPNERGFDRSIVVDQYSSFHSGWTASAAPPPPPSPGLAIGKSYYDYQHNDSQGYQTARTSGADIVHFTWMSEMNYDFYEGPERGVRYNSYNISTGTFNQGFGGTFVSLGLLARAGYTNGDVFENNAFQATFHQREDVSLPYNPWRLNFPTPGSPAHIDHGLSGYGAGGCPEVLWPRIATSRDGDRTVHIISHSNRNDCPLDLLWYWRHNGTTWTGPVIIDSTPQISYVLADDPSGDKMAVAVNVSNYTSMNGINNVAYLESLTDGAGWISCSEPIVKNVITSYDDDAGPGAWLHISTSYDNAGILHLIWDEQHDANDDDLTAIRHWNSQRQTVRTVAVAHYDTPFLTGVFNLNLAKMTLGIGDGETMCQGGAESNEDYLYVVYTQFGGPTPEEQADWSLEGRYNGELYLAVSNTGGLTWSQPENLTNTKTPKCNPGSDSLGMPIRPDSVCRSEHWATIGRIVSDIDIFFISDLDAGGIPQGEGTWQLNPVHYLRIPGGATDALHLCPTILPNFEASITQDIDCEWHADQLGTIFEAITISNLGNGQVDGEITVSDFPDVAMLTVSGGSSYAVPAGDPDDIRTVTMSANGAPEGLYQGMISITHNDPNEPSPREFPVPFFVFNEFSCPQSSTLKTGVQGPGSQ